MGLCALLALITLFFDYTLFFISAAITLVAFVALLFILRGLNKKSSDILEEIGQSILYTGEKGFVDAPIPVITVYDYNEIIWYNERCLSSVFDGADMRGKNIADVLPDIDVTVPSPPAGYAIDYGNRQYTAFVAVTRKGAANISVVYLVDDSELKYFTAEYHRTRPSVAIIMVDNYEEMVQDYKESERAQLMSEIENIIEQYIADNEGFVTRIEKDKFLAVIEERGILHIIDSKFDILDRVRNLHANRRMNPTLSIGVGRDAQTLYESESMARQALDMCLGRGGDQVAIRTQNGYDFYGGISKGIEKRTKVKTRIIATALNELIESSGNVIIMGHRFADLDCLGSSVGMLKAVKSMGKPVTICIDPQKNLVQPLLERLLTSTYTAQDFVSPEKALELVGNHTLLLILDTHVPHVLESESLYRACKTVVVIDHHRKLVSHIDNAVIFYHEPFASSASEMVSELIQYFPTRPQITKLEAEALLSGITLDTKNFILRTGVRTFEAAAYLRRMGADTVEVRKLFASSMESYQQKASLVANAEVYRRCAIASSDIQFENIKVVAPQAADELMTISGVDASFVIYLYESVVNVSARSMGELNVQVIMEKLGGGGHLTMAAAQFPNDSTDNIRERVVSAIDDYYASLNTPGPDTAAEPVNINQDRSDQTG
jgi:c-di-AMP phosphodiesterase-like protein